VKGELREGGEGMGKGVRLEQGFTGGEG